MVGKIVIHRDVAHGSPQFHAPFDVLERGQGFGRFFRGYAHVVGRRHRRQRIELVVHARQGPMNMCDFVLVVQHVEGLWVALHPKVAHGAAEAAHLAPAAGVENAGQALFQPVGDDAA